MEDNRFLLVVDDESGVWNSDLGSCRVVTAKSEEEAVILLNSEMAKGDRFAGGFLGPNLFQQMIKKDQGEVMRQVRLAAFAQIARGMGHELANVLLRIIGKVDLALLETSPEKIEAHLQVAMKAGERAAQVLRNLQAFSKSHPFLHEDSIQEALEKAIQGALPDLEKAKIHLERKFEQVPLMHFDMAKMSQAFLNLILNSVQAMSEGGSLTLSLKQSEGGVLIQIADTGSGIPRELLPEIFDYAFKNTGGKRSGLGLIVSKNIVEAHGGRIGIDSSKSGTEVKIWLPQR